VAAGVQRALDSSHVTFCFIGGVALQRWGETRYTSDVDLTIFCELGNEKDVLQVLEKHLTSRSEDVVDLLRFARMYLGRSPEGVEVDVSIGYTPYEQRMMERSVSVDFGVDVPLCCCSAEDLVILKTVAGRGQDWVDLQRIIQRSGDTMDWEMVFGELEPLLALIHEESRLDRLRNMVTAC